MEAIYNDTRVVLPEGTTAEEAKSALARIYPELASAVARVDGDKITFEVQSGTKGADASSGITAVYNDTRVILPEGTSTEEAKAALARIYPELSSAQAVLRGNEIHFEVQSGTKGDL